MGAGANGFIVIMLWAAAVFTPDAVRAAEEPDAQADPRETVIALPRGHLFRPLIADPKQPRFDVSLLWTRASARDTTAWAVAFGESFGIVRWRSDEGDHGVQLDLAGAVFAQFDLHTPSADLINADYVIGVPLSYRRGGMSVRMRVYHQSSHLGDEFLLQAHPQRINLSFESVDVLASYERGPWRAYGGGEYLFARDPRELAPRAVHGGFEYRQASAVFQIGQLGIGRVVAALDAKAWEQQEWRPMVSGKVGLAFDPVHAREQPGKRLSLLLQYYDGPSPYGQFFGQDVSYLGFGTVFSF